ncbi:DUF805 domain-containing protein [Sphingobacterium bovistauri]|uniref:DUF805 domain-containing protein n=1 Tax=Sphingobacterium bovistauri TaxID=2781959 RepID=A0ABS7Z7F3_9SPHI|nr:DUF805 domain-containing protein [Sphingobacterium bovistauri]MCA5005351.1 DUF805 domain-containing protein [Sphingobacterium bovistauri]
MEWFLKVVKDNYTNFNGRARRKEYWMFFLINMIISIVIGFIGGLIKFPLLATIYSVAILLPSIAVGIRRMHDVGKSGWYILIPIYNIILAATEGDRGSNEYGADPKGGENEDPFAGQRDPNNPFINS